ncbi:MAG: methyltransferase domain-containing protein [Acidimicrobiia bacterium]|jgi:SAM-dependent methyltransferase|nr:MAG: methyltransferase domain-containing protein [Acidimicrobiia bacterium]
MEWAGLAEWWLEEAQDAAYGTEVLPLLRSVLPGVAGATVLEVGCGEGQVLRMLTEAGAIAFGMDSEQALARRAGQAFRGVLPSLAAVRDGAVDGIVCNLVLEHLPSLDRVFDEWYRVTRPGGWCTLVVNHPLQTAPGAGPITDPDDGEVFLRVGEYFDRGWTDEPAGEGTVRFHHRPLGEVLEAAAMAGWRLERFEERAVSAEMRSSDPSWSGHEHVPRLLGARWRR